MKTFTFKTKDQKVTILASMIVGLRRLDDASFGPRTAIDTKCGAIYVVMESDDEYEARIVEWHQFLAA